MDQPAGYLHRGFILISYPNLILIGIMVVLFVAALLRPFPGHTSGEKGKKSWIPIYRVIWRGYSASRSRELS